LIFASDLRQRFVGINFAYDTEFEFAIELSKLEAHGLVSFPALTANYGSKLVVSFKGSPQLKAPSTNLEQSLVIDSRGVQF
jgi:hypothetical protein